MKTYQQAKEKYSLAARSLSICHEVSLCLYVTKRGKYFFGLNFGRDGI